MNTSVRNGLFVGVGALLLIVAGTFYFLNKPIEISKKDWVEINSDNNTGEQIVNAKDGSFSIKLSKDWFIEEPADTRISFYYPNNTFDCKIDFFVTDKYRDLVKIKEEIDKYQYEKEVTVISKKIENIKYKNISAIKFTLDTEETERGVSIIFVTDKKEFHVHLYTARNKNDVCEKRLEQFLELTNVPLNEK
jgi:hypothetical protein